MKKRKRRGTNRERQIERWIMSGAKRERDRKMRGQREKGIGNRRGKERKR